jgi:phosphopentomutase
MRRILLIVLDGLGIGELPDAGEYGDIGSNTLKNMADAGGGLTLPNLESLGLGCLGDFRGIGRPEKLTGSFGKMSETSKGKDTTSGHWEMMGVVVDKPFTTYPHGFPPEVINAFENAAGTKILGNKTASGTEIIKELGEEHIRTGKPIVYTSADSVFQIAAHEEVIPVEELYKMCELARNILKPPNNVGRVIARPFVGKAGSFQRTPRRKDFSLPPHKKTALEYISENGLEVISIGKVKDIFAGRGFTKSVLVSGNDDAVSKTITYFKSLERGLVWVTLVDFDTIYGHRNDPQGYAKALEDFDKKLSEIFEMLTERDILIITADHGCDPTTPSTDHSREYVPLLIYGNALKKGVDLGLRTSFSDLGATALEALGIENNIKGKSFWEKIKSP